MKKAVIKLDDAIFATPEMILEQKLKNESAIVQTDSMTVLKDFEQIDFANQLH